MEDRPRRHRLKARRFALRERLDRGMAEDEEPEFRALGGGDGSLANSRT
jgi:hypothetical protein